MSDAMLPATGCPKTMVFGPCGGVGTDGSCEVDGRHCPFVSRPAPVWPHPPATPRPVELPRIIVDLRPDLDAADFAASIETLGSVGAAGLIGDHIDDPAVPGVARQAAAVVGLGVPVIATVACRGRSADDARQRVDDLLEVGATAVLCVTGDHPMVRSIGHAQFDLDGPRLARLVRSAGGRAAVAANPASPPLSERPGRLRLKQDAGADMAILNHAGEVEDLVRFADRARRLGTTLPLAAPVPVITDRASLAALIQFPGLHLPRAFTHATGDQSVEAGVQRAVEFADALTATGRFDHINLSGRASAGGQLERADVMAEVIRRLSRAGGSITSASTGDTSP